jgi:hypothetical protein
LNYLLLTNRFILKKKNQLKNNKKQEEKKSKTKMEGGGKSSKNEENEKRNRNLLQSDATQRENAFAQADSTNTDSEDNIMQYLTRIHDSFKSLKNPL